MPLIRIEGRSSFHVKRSEKMKVKRSRSSASACGSSRKAEAGQAGARDAPFSVPESKDIKLMVSKMGYVPEDKPLLQGVFVRAASIEKLAQLAVDCFGIDGKPDKEKEDYPHVLFLMHQWMMESEDLAQHFLKQYKQCDSDIPCKLSGCRHTLTSLKCNRTQHKAKICHAVRYWIRNFPVCFDLNPQLSQAIHRLQGLIRQDSLENDATDMAQLVDTSKVPSYDWMRNMSVRAPASRHSSTRKVSLVFNNLRPTELAEQLTYMEYKAFRRITFNDYKCYAMRASLKDNIRLERSIALFNGLSQWIQCMVLSKTTPQQRADVIVKFVNVAKRLRQLQNFNTLMAVVGGLTHSSLARLGKTISCIPPDVQKDLTEYTVILSSSNNFINYRRVLNQCTGFRIPILGVHLKDLILLNTALPDMIGGSLINFRKMVQMSLIYTELMQVQKATLPVEPNMDLVNTIRLCLDLHYTEDEIYELSLAREPRNSLSMPSTPTKPIMFGDWVAGVSPPDPDMINKHVHDMVEAVFKNYDHDRDGFISHAEFDAIAGNFPFIDSFAVLDADQDGMISKVEMKTYFIRANCHALRKCFKHNFHETTYFKPSFCIHCTGLLWGLIKQGWKCKDCGINAHKHCKDLVVMECRSKAQGLRRNSFNGGHRDVTMASKRKMSQRQKRNRTSRGTQTDDGDITGTSVLFNNSPKEPETPPPPPPPPPLPLIELPEEPSEPPSSPSSPLLGAACSEEGRLSPGAVPVGMQEGAEATGQDPGSEGSQGGGCDEGEEYADTASAGCADCLQKYMCEGGSDCEQEENESLVKENQVLRCQLHAQVEQINTLRTHIGVIRQHTITFILDQMDTLQLQRDTEV